MVAQSLQEFAASAEGIEAACDEANEDDNPDVLHQPDEEDLTYAEGIE